VPGLTRDDESHRVYVGLSQSRSSSSTFSSQKVGLTYFARVDVDAEAGTIAWPDGLDRAPEPLYEEARRRPVGGARAAS
jgi:hypothetical protein